MYEQINLVIPSAFQTVAQTPGNRLSSMEAGTFINASPLGNDANSFLISDSRPFTN